jgi:hypothetical protein
MFVVIIDFTFHMFKQIFRSQCKSHRCAIFLGIDMIEISCRYWGQNSYGATNGADTANWQQRLSFYCNVCFVLYLCPDEFHSMTLL